MFHECPGLRDHKHAYNMPQAKALGRGNGGHDTASVSSSYIYKNFSSEHLTLSKTITMPLLVLILTKNSGM